MDTGDEIDDTKEVRWQEDEEFLRLSLTVVLDGKDANQLEQVAEFQRSEASVRSRLAGETGESKAGFAARDFIAP
jgi:hypothetical protein